MCGLTGFLYAAPGLADGELRAGLAPMAAAIVRRGPDSDGYWVDAAAGVGLAHRRLAIVDLTEAGHQPMVSASGRHVLVLNGEIYNHLALRAELDAAGLAPAWRGHSDTETLLAAVAAWGLVPALRRSVGMFALALWDRDTRCLTLARDRLGEKPLYYGWQGAGAGRCFLFGSELKALRAHPACGRAIDREALAYYMRHNRVGGSRSIYQGIRRLLPGSVLTLSARQPEPTVQRYWSVVEVAARGQTQPFAGGPTEAVDALEHVLRSAIAGQMVADVPLGAFLSGGVDSSLVVALMQAQAARPVRTFSIGFREPGYDEAGHARAVASHLGTDHTELYMTPEQAQAVIPELPGIYCEPFADSSQIPTLLVSRLARQHVTVSLSGDGGDELFCGYTRYALTARLWRHLAPWPMPVRRALAGAIRTLSPQAWDKLTAWLPLRRVGDRLHKGADLLNQGSCEALYSGLIAHWAHPSDVLLGDPLPVGLLPDDAGTLRAEDDRERMMLLDMLTYLPDDILVKVDRAAMACSLETRVPLLDHRVVEFAAALPLSLKLRDGQQKWALRQVLYRHVPQALIDRPKMGFGVPIGQWLRGPLRDWAEGLLSQRRLLDEGHFRADVVRRKWQEHLAGHRDWQAQLWDVLMFQAWLEHERAC